MTISVKNDLQKSKKSKRNIIETTGVVSDMIRQTSNTKTLRITTPFLDENQSPFQFKPGQFVMVRPEIKNKMIPRAYSISSSPTRSMKKNGYFDLTVRQTEKPLVSKWLNKRKNGDEIQFRGPYGNFFWDENDFHAEQLVLMGAGSGITPLKSILEYIHDKRYENKVELLYSCRYESEIISKKELEELIKYTLNAKLILTLTRENEESKWPGHRGRLNKKLIENELRSNNFNLEKTKFYLCGTSDFVNAMIDILFDIGIEKQCILHEKWD